MLFKLAAKTADWFAKENDTRYKDVETYQYGFFIIYSNLFFLIITLVLGVVFKAILPSFIFFLTFFSIRQFAGGFHASTEIRCEILSTLFIAASIGIIKLAQIYSFNTVLLCITAAAAVCILILCPLDTPEKPLSEKEFKHFRKISLIILTVIITAVIISYALKFTPVFAPCCMSTIIECVLLILGKIKK